MIAFISDALRRRQGWALCTLALLSVAGCSAGLPGGGDGASGFSARGGLLSGLSAPRAPDKPLSSAALVGGDVVVRGPDGWCIESGSLQARGQRGFALLIGCRALTGGQSGPRVASGALTATISARGAGQGIELAAALREAIGETPVRSESGSDAVALIQLKPATTTSESGLGEPHWRALFVVQDRLVALAAYGPSGGEISGSTGGTLLRALADNIRAATPTPPVSRAKSGLDLMGPFGRLSN